MTAKLTLLATALSSGFLLAEDYEVKAQLFEQSLTLEGLAVPNKGVEVEIAPQVWGDFIVESVIQHGAAVKKGEVLIQADTQKVDEYIAAQEVEAKIDKVKLEKLELELKALEVDTARKLQDAETAWNRELEDFSYYKKTALPLSLEQAEMRANRAEWYLDYTKEELNQLLKMYEADGLTEETEEIIVQRARNAVKAEELDNKETKISVKREVETTIVRAEKDRDRLHEKKKTDWKFAQKSIPAELEIKRLELEKFQLEIAKKAENLSKVKADRKAMSVTAPIDGIVYYGEFDSAQWKRDLANKSLLRGAKLPAKRTLLTVVPKPQTHRLVIAADAYAQARLKQNANGNAKPQSQPWHGVEGVIENISTVPNATTTQWDVEFVLDNATHSVAVGEKLNVTFVTYSKEDALAIPAEAVTTKHDGSYVVQLKQGDESVETIIQVGESNATQVEVIGGIKAGQTIVFEKDKK